MLDRKHLALLALLGMAVACGDDHSDDDHAEDESPAGPDSGATCPTDSTLTYDNFAKDFFATYCTSCHAKSVTGAARQGAPTDHNFDTQAGIDSALEHIDQTAASGPSSTNTSMPFAGPKPTTAEREKLGEWIACGAP